MARFLKSLYLHQRFFVALFSLAAGFLLSYWFPEFYPLVWVLVILLGFLLLGDMVALYRSTLRAERILPEKLSNSDENPIVIWIRNDYSFEIHSEIIDEIPVQFQKRNFLKKLRVPARQMVSFEYFLRPVERGEYYFGKLNIYASTKMNLVKRRFEFQKEQMVKVYPSFIQMKRYDFLAIDSRVSQAGLKKIRKIGHTMEFEQIKDYVPGDDVRTINWKATAKQSNLMVNQFQDEKSQPVYSIIDKSRAMKMPFDNLKLLDYAINSTLAFSNIALKRKDKVGMLTFSNTTKNYMVASSKPTQLRGIQENLYNINTSFMDADFGLLYAHIKRRVTQRSLLLLYTNFEHISGLQRQLPYLLALSRKHLLVVILFENTALESLVNLSANNVSEVTDQAIAEQFVYEKRLMVRELQKYRIQTVLTKPEDLSIKTINKYLELKARGML